MEVLLYNFFDDEEEDEILLAGMMRDDVSDIYKKRDCEGSFKILIHRHLLDNEDKFRQYFRVSRELFHRILSAIQHDILKSSCNRVGKPITPVEKLCITLRFLATGESYRSLAFQFRISHSWISKFIPIVLRAICQRLLKEAMPKPDRNRLKQTAEEFCDLWNFPNCCGALDGKHIRIVKPKNSGSLFFNYKSYFSIVLLALVDANYKFLAIDVGSYGKEGDAGIFTKSNLGKCISDGSFEFPEPMPLPGTDIILPHVIVGDEAFKLTVNIMRPYPKEKSTSDIQKAIYNYRHSRARRTSENAFGILCQYFRIFHTPIAVKPETVDDLTMAACTIHNLLINEHIPNLSESAEHTFCLPKENVQPLARLGSNATNEAFKIRDAFAEYFCSRQGEVNWQMKLVTRTN